MPSHNLADYKAPYPEATDDQKRYVIFLDEKPDEENYKVQLIPGRIENVDGCNRHFIGGKIEEKTINGWGYDYYVVQLGPMAGTLMAPVGPGAEKRPKFVMMHNDKLMRYNSKLPIVVYVPKDAELRYKIWSAQPANSEGMKAEEH